MKVFYVSTYMINSIGTFVNFSREYLVDLVGKPGAFSQPDSSLNSALSVLVSSPLCHPKFKYVKTAHNLRMLAKLYFVDCQSVSLAFDDASSGNSLISSFMF